MVNRGVAEGEGWTGGSPAPSAFSADSQAAMLEGASEIDRLIQQAYFTSMILETAQGRSWRSEWKWGTRDPSLTSTPRATLCPSYNLL